MTYIEIYCVLMVTCGLIAGASTFGPDGSKLQGFLSKLNPIQGIAGTMLAISSFYALFKSLPLTDLSLAIWILIPFLIFGSGICLGLVLGFDFICTKIKVADKLKGIVSELKKYKIALGWINLSYGYLGLVVCLYSEYIISQIGKFFSHI